MAKHWDSFLSYCILGQWDQRHVWSMFASLSCLLQLMQHKLEEDRSPASPILIIAFISSCTQLYMRGDFGKLHLYNMSLAYSSQASMQVKVALMGATIPAPLTSRCPRRAPVMVGQMDSIFSKLDLANPLDTVVMSCFSTIFYSSAHTGKFMLSTLNAFDPT